MKQIDATEMHELIGVEFHHAGSNGTSPLIFSKNLIKRSTDAVFTRFLVS